MKSVLLLLFVVFIVSLKIGCFFSLTHRNLIKALAFSQENDGQQDQGAQNDQQDQGGQNCDCSQVCQRHGPPPGGKHGGKGR